MDKTEFLDQAETTRREFDLFLKQKMLSNQCSFNIQLEQRLLLEQCSNLLALNCVCLDNSAPSGYRSLSLEELSSMTFNERICTARAVADIMIEFEKRCIFPGCIEIGAIYRSNNHPADLLIGCIEKFQIGFLTQSWDIYEGDMDIVFKAQGGFFCSEQQQLVNQRIILKILTASGEILDEDRVEAYGLHYKSNPLFSLDSPPETVDLPKLLDDLMKTDVPHLGINKAAAHSPAAQSQDELPAIQNREISLYYIAAACSFKECRSLVNRQILLIKRVMAESGFSEFIANETVISALPQRSCRAYGEDVSVFGPLPFDTERLPNIQLIDNPNEGDECFLRQYIAFENLMHCSPQRRYHVVFFIGKHCVYKSVDTLSARLNILNGHNVIPIWIKDEDDSVIIHLDQSQLRFSMNEICQAIQHIKSVAS